MYNFNLNLLSQTGPGQLVTRYVGNISSLLARCVVVWLVATILLMSSAVLYFTSTTA